MGQPTDPGQIVILNGAPWSGKSSIVTVIQEKFEGLWMNLAVDTFVLYVTPGRYRPGIGLRPGGERRNLEPLVEVLYAAMYESIAAHSRLGLNVAVDVGHHDGYTVPRRILTQCAREASRPACVIRRRSLPNRSDHGTSPDSSARPRKPVCHRHG